MPLAFIGCLNSVITLASLSETSSLQLVSVAELSGFSPTWSSTLKTVFLAMCGSYLIEENKCALHTMLRVFCLRIEITILRLYRVMKNISLV